MKHLWRDPLFGFLIAGAAIFAFDRFTGDTVDVPVIEVTAAQLQRISNQWQGQMGRPPTDQQLNGLLEQWLREEIYYREARAMGLDDNDTIIRRRLTQKLTFLTEDLADASTLDENELRAHYDQAQGQYTEPEHFSFEHRYFSSERRADARADALAAMQVAQPAADPFMLQSSYASRSQREIGDLFGREFARELASLKVTNTWAGPVQSAYGWHLVKLIDRQPQRLLPFAQVRARVSNDLHMQRRQAANDTLYTELRNRYDIRFPDPEP
jgi:peptidyl-prolyl cis-trans isomerase C